MHNYPVAPTKHFSVAFHYTAYSYNGNRKQFCSENTFCRLPLLRAYGFTDISAIKPFMNLYMNKDLVTNNGESSLLSITADHHIGMRYWLSIRLNFTGQLNFTDHINRQTTRSVIKHYQDHLLAHSEIKGSFP